MRIATCLKNVGAAIARPITARLFRVTKLTYNVTDHHVYVRKGRSSQYIFSRSTFHASVKSNKTSLQYKFLFGLWLLLFALYIPPLEWVVPFIPSLNNLVPYVPFSWRGLLRLVALYITCMTAKELALTNYNSVKFGDECQSMRVKLTDGSVNALLSAVLGDVGGLVGGAQQRVERRREGGGVGEGGGGGGGDRGRQQEGVGVGEGDGGSDVDSDVDGVPPGGGEIERGEGFEGY